MKRIALLLSILAAVAPVSAQSEQVYDFPIFDWYIGTVVLAGLVIVWAFYTLFKLTRYLDEELRISKQKLAGTWVEPKPIVKEPEPEEEQLSEGEQRSVMHLIHDWVPIEEEASITLDHDYDGIRELDNRLPPWWTALFYVTIAFSVVYMLHYHVLKTGDSPVESYEKSVIKAHEERLARLASSTDDISAKTVTVLTDASSLKAGAEIFQQNCQTCHGVYGEGILGAGPNMTDPYWIHGGAISDLYTTIRYGVPAKGMIAWKDQLPPKQIQQVASFILSLQGTNPANAIPAQGELYIPEIEAEQPETPEDSTDLRISRAGL